MGVTYAFFAYGFLPIIFPSAMTALLYWSNTIQLWSLPLILVGQNVAARSINKMIQETHAVVLEEVALIREDHAALTDLVKELHTKEGSL
jgi:hypothetical protein